MSCKVEVELFLEKLRGLSPPAIELLLGRGSATELVYVFFLIPSIRGPAGESAGLLPLVWVRACSTMQAGRGGDRVMRTSPGHVFLSISRKRGGGGGLAVS